MTRRRGAALALAAFVAGLGGLYGGWHLLKELRHRAVLADAHVQIREGRHASAARHLSALLEQEPGMGEAAYLLGLCERARGQVATSWGRIPPDSPFSGPATIGLAVLESDHGRLAAAEDILARALVDPRRDRLDLRRLYASLCWHEGRLEEARRSIDVNWEELDRAGRSGTDQAIELVRFRIAMGLGLSSIESLRAYLDRMAQSAPDDDRVWLGRANLAIRQGALDEAERWLDDCQRRRPGDIPVWRARLDWAVAAGRVAEARAALEHLPADEAATGETDRLAAWLAARRGDLLSERNALEHLLAADPGDSAALERLAELDLREGRTALAAERLRGKAALDLLRSRYKELFLRDQRIRDAPEMARLAERLGQPFEALALWTFAVATRPDREDFRTALADFRRRHPKATVARTERTLGECLAPWLDAAAGPERQPKSSTTGPPTGGSVVPAPQGRS